MLLEYKSREKNSGIRNEPQNPMARFQDEDLFQTSTMTFGEHLEELRVCLIRATVGLLVAVLLGFLVAQPVVHLIEQPLRRALGNYYTERSIETFDAWQPRVAGGPSLPYSREEILDAVEGHGMSFELREVHADRLARVLGDSAPMATPATHFQKRPRMTHTARTMQVLAWPVRLISMRWCRCSSGNRCRKMPE